LVDNQVLITSQAVIVFEGELSFVR
jgi:hypothetical protein